MAISNTPMNAAAEVRRWRGKGCRSLHIHLNQTRAMAARAMKNIHVKHEIDRLDGRFTRVNQGRLCAILALEAGSAVSYGSGDAKKRIF